MAFQTVTSRKISLTRDRFSTNASFEAILSKNADAPLEYKLTLKLRLCMQQINPTAMMPIALDSDSKPFWILRWDTADWNTFLADTQAQAKLWNNQFWLRGLDVADYDLTTFSGDRLRPYFRCELEIEFVPAPEAADATIRVAKVDLDKYRNPKNFRSASLLWDAQDATPSVISGRIQGGDKKPFTQPTIAHEIGHRLGLYHIGVLQKAALCELAIALDEAGYGKIGHEHLSGGRNADYCYGWDQPEAVGQNIMGMGSTFTVDNALPWLWSIRLLRSKGAEVWEALTAFPGYSYVTR